jgi:hypothetical protein
MSIGGMQLESIEEKDLQALRENKVVEGKTIEYKLCLPSAREASKKEFLADVSSFANAVGGDLVFGIKAKAGVPEEICGMEVSDADAENRRLEDIIRYGVEPRIPGIAIRAVRLSTSRVVIVVRIPRSWALPHRVTYGKDWQFFSRTSVGKQPLNVPEIRALFGLSETTLERIRGFRAERLCKVVAGETPVALEGNALIVLHIVPFGAFDPATRFDVPSLARDRGRFRPGLGPITGMYGWNCRPNFDGLLTCASGGRPSSACLYLQIFRNGSVESVDGGILKDGATIPSVLYEEGLLDALRRYLGVQRELGVEPPLFVIVSLLGVKGYTMAVDDSMLWSHNLEAYPIDRDSLVVPEVMVEGFECEPGEVMRPIFDAVWNAAGLPRCINYDARRKWVGH